VSNVLNADAIHKIARKVILQKHVQGAHGIVVVAGLLIMRIHLNVTIFILCWKAFSFCYQPKLNDKNKKRD
jgi:hypothetical protein